VLLYKAVQANLFEKLPLRYQGYQEFAGRFEIGGTALPRFTAMVSITTPVVVRITGASADDSTPKSRRGSSPWT
jgi:hypothetical protein